MRNILRIVAVIVMLGAIAFWFAAGANRGWTKTRIPITIADPVTGLEGIRWQDKFAPGVDFLAAALMGAGLLTGVSFCVPIKSK